MAEYDISLTTNQVEGLLTNDDGLKGLVTVVVNQVLEAQMSEHLSAGHYERLVFVSARAERLTFRASTW